MKSFRIKVTVNKTATITEEEWRKEGGIGEFNEFAASQYVKGMLIEELRNNLNRGTVQLLPDLK